jgi:hypothetical protein
MTKMGGTVAFSGAGGGGVELGDDFGDGALL